MEVFEKGRRKSRLYAVLAFVLATGLLAWGFYDIYGGGRQPDPLILIGAIVCLWIYTLVDARRMIETLNKENYVLRRHNIDIARQYTRSHDARVERLLR